MLPRQKKPLLLAVAALCALWIACFWVFEKKAFDIATTDPDWSHILAIPLVALWWLHSLKDRLRQAPVAPAWHGLAPLLLGLFAYAAALFPIRNGMAEGGAMLLALAGLVLLLLGKAHLRLLLPVILFLGFTIRVSDRAWELVTAKLQTVAASGAAGTLDILGLFLPGHVEAQLNGNTITLLQSTAAGMQAHPLNVAEACSGIRSLMAFMALGFVMAWLPEGRLLWQRIGMTVLAVPVALVVNIGRVTALGLLTLVNPELAKGDFHLLVGLLMLLPAAGLLLGCGWVMEKLVVREEDAVLKKNPDREGGDTCALVNSGIPSSPPSRSGFFFKTAGLGTLPAILGSILWLACLKLPALAGLSTAAAIAVCGGAFLVVVAAFAVVVKAQLARAPHAFTCALSIALGCLGASLIGQQIVIRATQAVLFKEALPLRRDLHTLAHALGPWQMLKEEPPESPEVERALGTRDYITRWYADDGGQQVRLHLAYYTGGVDTVPHVPDRCFVAAGAKPLEVTEIPLKINGTNLRATLFRYANAAGGESAVVYFFSANGHFLASPNEVRLQGFNLTDRYGYHCKVEVEFHGLTDAAEVTRAAERFLDEALPQVLDCLPAWPVGHSDSIQRGR